MQLCGSPVRLSRPRELQFDVHATLQFENRRAGAWQSVRLPTIALSLKTHLAAVSSTAGSLRSPASPPNRAGVLWGAKSQLILSYCASCRSFHRTYIRDEFQQLGCFRRAEQGLKKREKPWPRSSASTWAQQT